jgi:hypothetical protein
LGGELELARRLVNHLDTIVGGIRLEGASGSPRVSATAGLAVGYTRGNESEGDEGLAWATEKFEAEGVSETSSVIGDGERGVDGGSIASTWLENRVGWELDLSRASCGSSSNASGENEGLLCVHCDVGICE